MLKKLLSVILSVLMVALLFISAFSVSALSPPYSKNFETQSEMISSLSDYSASFPEVEDYFAGDLSAPREGYHLENREVIIPVLSAEGYTANAFSYAESSWGKGVDYTFTSYLNESNNYTWRFMTYYSLNKEELSESFDVGFKPTEGYIGDYKYIAYDSYSNMLDYEYTVCKVIVGDCLVVIHSSRDFYEKHDAIQFVSTEIEIPVYVKDPFEYPPIAEGCHRYFFYMPESWENEFSQTASIYWWEGTGAHESWPGAEAHKGDAEGLYYYDVPKDVTTLMWANNMDSTLAFTSPEYKGAKATCNIGTEFYYPGESDLYPDGVENFNNMVYVVNIERQSENAGRPLVVEYYGEWYYYYGNGEYGTTPERGEVVYTQRHFGERDCYFDLPEVAEGCNRYFFYMPESWENELSKTAGIYWWEGSGAHESWPGAEAHKGDADGLYYYDVPKDVSAIIWNNRVVYDHTKDDYHLTLEYELAEQTENIATEYYEPGESELYPDGLESFNNMVYVVDFEKCNCNDLVLPLKFGGEWYYYYGNGEYGTTPARGEVVYTDRSFGENCPHEHPVIPPEEPDLEPFSRIYFVNTEGWEKVYAYAWMNDYEYQNAQWPGEEMELSHIDSAGNEIYTALITSKAQGLIFCNGVDKQTTDLTSGVYEGNMYCIFDEYNGKYTVMIREFISDYPFGDANLDGRFNVKDATTVQKYVAGLIISDRFEQTLMDFDKDTQINVKDATAMQKSIAGLI